MFVFDEMSMYGKELFMPVAKKIAQLRKFCLIIGDSCQLPPVQQTALNWSWGSELFRELPISVKCEDGDAIRIVRFTNSTSGAYLRNLIIALRRLILEQIAAKNLKQQFLANDLDERWLSLWQTLFCSSLTIDATITFDKILESIIAAQALVNSLFDLLRQANFYEELEHDTDDPDPVLAKFSQFVRDKFSLPHLPVVIGYENSFNFEVLDYVLRDKTIMDTSGPNCWRRGEEIKQHVPFKVHNVLILLDDAVFKYVGQIEENVAPNLMCESNTFSPGMFIRCRENCTSQGTFNGQTGLFVGFFVKDTLPASFESVRFAQLFPKTSGRGLESRVLTGVKFNRPRFSDSISPLTSAICMVFYDLAKQRFAKCHPVLKFLCEACTSSSRCQTHLGVRAPIGYLCFNWTCNYAQTVHNIQGATLETERVFLLGEKVLKNNILRTLYVVLSRCKSSDQLVVDKDFIIKAFKAIFNHPAKTIEKALKSFGLSFF